MASNNPWELMRELGAIHDRMNRIWGGAYERGHDDVTSHGAWLPPVDIYQTEGGEVVLRAELPGVRREDIDLTVENTTLTLKGQRRPDEDVREDQYQRQERSYGSFSRSFTLPAFIEPAGVRAEYRDGMLTITLPLRQEARPRQIKVEVND